MEHTTHLGVVPMPGATTSFPLSVDLHIGPRQTTASTPAEAALGQIDTATAGTEQPQRDTAASPGFVTIEPTPSGYRGVARLAGSELTRVMDYGKRLERLLDLARQADGDDGDDGRESQ